MYSEAKNFKMNDFVTRFCKFKFPRDKKHIWKYYKIIVNVNLHWMWLIRISCFIFRLNKNLFIKFTLSGMMRSKSYKSAFGRTMHVSCILYIYIYTFPCRAQRYSCSHSLSLSHFFLQSPFRFYACPLIAAFCLQDQIIVTAVECSLRGAFVSASASPWT